LRKVYAWVSLFNDKYGYSVNFGKWLAFIKLVKQSLLTTLSNTTEIERAFFQIVRSKTPAELSFEEFVDALKQFARHAVLYLLDGSEQPNYLL